MSNATVDAMADNAQQVRAAIALAQSGQGKLVDAAHIVDDILPHVDVVSGGFIVAIWVFVSDQAVAEELSAETVKRLEVA